MRLGFKPVLDRSRGGVYQYSRLMQRALEGLRTELGGVQPCLVVDAAESELVKECEPDPAWKIVTFGRPVPAIVRALKSVMGDRPIRSLARRGRRIAVMLISLLRDGFSSKASSVAVEPAAGELSRHLDLLLLPAPDLVGASLGVPLVLAVHDLQHRLQPEFSEVSAGPVWAGTEMLYRVCLAASVLIIAESDSGKEDILELYEPYGVRASRIHVLPYVPLPQPATPGVEAVDVRSKYRLPAHYLFYPAQFWPHKNHARIILALERLKLSEGLEVPIAFAGAAHDEIRQRHYAALRSMVELAGLDGQVHWLGYVPDGDMSSLYRHARGLVMPTFFGPTNMPVVEAWAAGCPVLTSALRGIREQVGDAALLVNPRSTPEIAKGIACLWQDEAVRQALVARGFDRLRVFSEESFRKGLLAAVRTAQTHLASGAGGYRGSEGA